MSRPFGFINLNKPSGQTSRQAINRIAKLAKPAKVGHAGTLDPLATGVLVVCVGPATRLVPFVQSQRKTYRATFLLGSRSNTDDIDGEVVSSQFEGDIVITDIEALLPNFVGQIEQVPPKYSAVHVKGERAYKMARRGKDLELTARKVEIYRLELIRFEYPELELLIECGSGTYVRSLGRDLGERLGCGAVMSALNRMAIGPFEFCDSISTQTLTEENWRDALLPPSLAIPEMPQHSVTEEEVALLRNGRIIPANQNSDWKTASEVAIVDVDDQLISIANYRSEDGTLAPKLVFPSE